MASYHHEYKPHVLSLTNSNMRFTIEFLVTFYNNASMFPSATPTLDARLLRTCNRMARVRRLLQALRHCCFQTMQTLQNDVVQRWGSWFSACRCTYYNMTNVQHSFLILAVEERINERVMTPMASFVNELKVWRVDFVAAFCFVRLLGRFAAAANSMLCLQGFFWCVWLDVRITSSCLTGCGCSPGS